MPNILPGYQSVDDPEVRARFEAGWNVKLPTTKGLDNHEMIEAIHEGKLKAMYLFGEEISLVDSNSNFVNDGLAKLEFFVVQDIFFSKTCQFADVVLPASPSLEKEGTFTSTERRIQRLYQVFEPLEGSRPDWQIIQDVANRLGANWNYQHPSEIYREIASLTPLFAGVTYERLEGYKSLQWPVAADGTDEPLLYTKRFNFPDGKARLFPLVLSEPTDQPNEEFDLHLNNGRLLEHFHEGNLTYRSEGIREKTPDTFVEVSPELAAERGIQSGTWVQLISRYGKVRVRAVVTDRVQGQGALHADELHREPGEPTHQQPHRQDNSHAGLQGNLGQPARACRTWRKSAASHQFTASAIRRRRRASKWNGNGSVRIIEFPEVKAADNSRDKNRRKRTLKNVSLNPQPATNMAQPIPLNLPARDPRAELQLRLQNAPLEHAEALLSAYEVLQGLHDRGVFELMRGALGSSDKVIEIIVEASKTPESIRGIRNLIILTKILGTIEPELVEGFARSCPRLLPRRKHATQNRPASGVS